MNCLSPSGQSESIAVGLRDFAQDIDARAGRMGAMTNACTVVVCAGLAAMPLAGQVKITPSGDKVAVQIAGKPFTHFYVAGEAFHAKVTKPYLWPLRAASGTPITRAWPMEEVADEQGEKKP